MAIVAGIDEAGFGPLLGPLVVSGVAFRVPDERANSCLWDALRSTCTKATSKSARRLVIADSKQLYKSGHLAPLERAALVMLGQRGASPACLRDMLDGVAPGATAAMDQYPWYASRDVTLPASDEVGDVATRANAVRRDREAQKIDMLGPFCEPLLEGHYNRLVGGTRNKGVALMGLALKVMDRILRAAPGEHIRLCVDRLGGRTHYREALGDAWPGHELQIVEESDARSVYRLVRSERVCRVEFVTEGETHHFAIALASVYSKYLRELFMRMFNEYWRELQPDLAPTAGYYTDAQRWLKDADPLLRRLKVDRNLLVRQR